MREGLTKIQLLTVSMFIIALVGLGLDMRLSAGMLTYSIDDGHHSAYEIALPILSLYGQVATINMVTSYIGKEKWLNRRQLLDMQSNGWEVCSHSVTHPHFSKIPLTYDDEIMNDWSAYEGLEYVFVTDYQYKEIPFVLESGSPLLLLGDVYQVEAEPGSYYFDGSNSALFVHTKKGSAPEPDSIRTDSVQRELELSKSILNDMGLKVRSFVVPYHDWDKNKEVLGTMYYVSVSAGPQNMWINPIPLADKYNLVRLVVKSETSVNALKWWINKAIKENCWIILCFHYFGENDGLDASYWSPEKFEELAAWVHEQNIKVVTQQEGVELSDTLLHSMDCDNDCDIDGQELSLFVGSFGSSIGSNRYIPRLDLDQNGKINASDLLTFARGFGNSEILCE